MSQCEALPESEDRKNPQEALVSAFEAVRQEISGVIVGQETIVEHLLIALFCQGHVLVVGVPGLAKTLLLRTVASAVGLDFSRIQFTPDLMPADIIGTELVEEDPATGRRGLRFVRGPIFCNILLADEINRTPPKTQAALLEAMEEGQVTAAGETHRLEPPFWVVATQNPIEQEGTYPLPEAQLDRFMLGLWMDYPSREQEKEILRRSEEILAHRVRPVISSSQLLAFRRLLGQVPVSEHVLDYVLTVVRGSRPQQTPSDLTEWIAWGAGPRAGQDLLLASRCRALVQGRSTPSCDDVRAMTVPALRHRIVLNYRAMAEGMTVPDILHNLLDGASEPQY